jgi:hypothetical protein
MIQFIRTNKDNISILLDREGMADILLSIESLLDEKMMRVDLHMYYANLIPRDGIQKNNDRTLSIVKTEFEYEGMIFWSASHIIMVLASESIDYLNFKLTEYRDTGFVFPTEVLELYSTNMKHQANISLIPLED